MVVLLGAGLPAWAQEPFAVPTSGTIVGPAFDPYASGCCPPLGCPVYGAQPSWYGGAGLVWVKPYYEDHEAFTILDAQGISEFNVDQEFNADYEITPRFWLGFKGCDGFGGRVRYWEYDHTGDPLSANNTVAGQQFGALAGNNVNDAISATILTAVGAGSISAQHGMELQTWDMEATQDMVWGQNQVTFFGGLRYARMNQLYGSAVFAGQNLTGNGLFILHAHNFNGWGPTVGFELQHSIGGIGLGVFFGLRQSILFGEADQVVTFGGNTNAPFTGVRSDIDESLAITELQIGLEFQRELASGVAVVGRVGYEGQFWHGAGGPNSTLTDLGLEGFLASVGFSR